MSANWKPGKQPGTVVCDRTADGPELAHHLDYYGGYLVAESIAPENVPVISAALDLLEACRKVSAFTCGCHSTSEVDWHSSRCFIPQIRAAIAKAEKKQETT